VVTEAGAIECLVHVCVHACEYMGVRECAAVGLMSSTFLHMPRVLAESCLCHVCMCVCVFQSVYVCVRAQVITESSTNKYCACGCVGVWVSGCANVLQVLL